jgi:hypothetical protein
MIVVSDASPLINLAVVGHLELLRQLYGSLKIPKAVSEEIIKANQSMPSWIDTHFVSNQALAIALMVELDPGEAEAIALAIELPADLLLIDERIGRRMAARFGLKFTGILGVLTEAKSKGLIPAVKPIMDDLRLKAGFWISESLYQRVLQAAGE